MKNLFIFDLDNTLAVSKSALSKNMSNLLKKLIRVRKVAIISGGDYPQFEEYVAPSLISDKENLNNLFFLPNSGSKFYEFIDGIPMKKYSYDLSSTDKEKIIAILMRATKNLDTVEIFGEQIEDRGSQITFSALGQKAPPELKKIWDADMEKRAQIKKDIMDELNDFNISINGGTSINITKKGMDKKFGILKLQEFLEIPLEQMIFFGDELGEHGNDYPIIESGIDWVHVRDHLETENILKSLLHFL